MLYGPNDAKWYLANSYGPSWETDIVIVKHDRRILREQRNRKYDGIFVSTA